MTPEQRARQQIDPLLQQSGWIVQDRSQTNLAAGPGVAIREALFRRVGGNCEGFTRSYKTGAAFTRYPGEKSPIDRNDIVEKLPI
jgi:hypothetical protein